MGRQVLLYELNEVPWALVDFYVAHRPGSALAELLPSAKQLTTVCEDPVSLQPWRTWPTFHSSRYTEEHSSYDLGQDPATFRLEPIWEAADSAGKAVGLFGPLQSWPPRRFRNGGFYVPDTFARTAEVYPESLAGFQSFNLKMTQANTFSAESRLSIKDLLHAGAGLVRQGVSLRSAAAIGRHLIDERRDPRYKGARPTMQALPSFDLFWQLHRRFSPDLSIFFTNHVAAMMHRYWADAMPGYDLADYHPDEVFAGFIEKAMDLFDYHLRRMLRWLGKNPGAVLVIASSMGQGAIPKEDVDETFVVDDSRRLLSALGLDAEPGNAMYPRVSYLLDTPEAADRAVEVLRTVRVAGGDIFEDVRCTGRSISLSIDQHSWVRSRGSREATYTPYGDGGSRSSSIDDLGISVRRRMGGGNTAYHIPQGIFLAAGRALEPDRARAEVSILDAAPSILTALGVSPPTSYRGSPSIRL